jgi:predicted PurR-regulated permease PerM
MIVTIIILSILLCVSVFVIFNLLQKLERYEDTFDETDEFIQDEIKRNKALLEALRQIDNRQMFEKDDDVGSVFNQIKETIQRFKSR